MDEDKSNLRSGFRIKWGDREVEYYGDAAKEVFAEVFSTMRNMPTPAQHISNIQGTEKIEPQQAPKQFENEVYDRIAKDVGTSVEKVKQVIKLEERKGFPDLVPVLPTHPDVRHAVRLVGYAIQVGEQKSPIEVSYLKDMLKKVNGYPLAGREFGLILQDFRKSDAIIASKTQERNMPITFSTKGLEEARKILLSAITA